MGDEEDDDEGEGLIVHLGSEGLHTAEADTGEQERGQREPAAQREGQSRQQCGRHRPSGVRAVVCPHLDRQEHGQADPEQQVGVAADEGHGLTVRRHRVTWGPSWE